MDGIYSSRGNYNQLYMYANVDPIKYLLLQVQWSSGSRRRLYTAKIPSSNLGWIMFRGCLLIFLFFYYHNQAIVILSALWLLIYTVWIIVLLLLSRNLLQMDPFTFTFFDDNVSHQLYADTDPSTHPDHASSALTFGTNIRYIFEDDQDQPLGEEQEVKNDEGIENVVIMQLDDCLNISNMELISDNYQLLSYESHTDNHVSLQVLSKFEELVDEHLTLEELRSLYSTQNKQLQKIISLLG